MLNGKKHIHYGSLIVITCILLLIASALFSSGLGPYGGMVFIVWLIFWEQTKSNLWKCPQCGYFFERAK
jgi:hypothetical protein